MPRKRDLFWRLRLLGPREIAGIAIMISLVATALAVSLFYHRQNFGFGPEWDCNNPGAGGPVCVKKTDTEGQN